MSEQNYSSGPVLNLSLIREFCKFRKVKTGTGGKIIIEYSINTENLDFLIGIKLKQEIERPPIPRWICEIQILIG